MPIDPAQIVTLVETLPRPHLVAMLRTLRDNVLRDRPKHDVSIGGEDNPYMLRWWLVPRNELGFNVYLHHFIRSDRDTLHDHPWGNLSILIDGSYDELVPADPAKPGGDTLRIRRDEGSITLRPDPTFCHRVELLPDLRKDWSGRLSKTGLLPVWTIFITGPKVRDWGFHCPSGWIDWMTFTGQTEADGPVRKYNDVRGCGEV